MLLKLYGLYTVDQAAGTSVLDGSLTIASSSSTTGSWTASARDLTFKDGSVDSGEVEVERNTFPYVKVTFVFTAPDEGTWTLTPPGVGVTGTFSL